MEHIEMAALARLQVAAPTNGKIKHPFEGGKKATSVTKQHRPLIWEAMLGTVNARNPKTGAQEYFDYDYDKAHAFAMVSKCTDLRTCRVTTRYQGYPARGTLALWGIPPQD